MKRFLIVVLFFCSIINISSVDSAKPKIVYIDPGHGGFDGGAIAEGIIEKDITLSISLMLRDYLVNSGFVVYLTREDDVSLETDIKHKKRTDIQKRVELINSSDCDIFISIHLNSFPIKSLSGAQTFYMGDRNKRLASIVQNNFTRILGNTSRIEKEINDIYLLEHVNKKGVLAEVGFLSNENEKKLLLDQEYQGKISYSLYISILEYFS